MQNQMELYAFYPGLVGGHCIGVDPYYLTYKAKEIGFNPKIILAGRKINDGMGFFIANSAINEIKKKGLNPNKCKITILGLTFKGRLSRYAEIQK